MTGYHMRLGYMPYLVGGNEARKRCWRTFKRVVAKVREQPQLILHEVQTVERKHWDKEAWAKEYSKAAEVDGFKIVHINETVQEIWLAAAGGELIKHRFRRAFCRLVMREMNRRDIVINLIVA